MIVIAIFGIVVEIAVRDWEQLNNTDTPEQRYTQCISGLTFTKENEPKQIISLEGKGIPCGSAKHSHDNTNSYENTWNN